MFSNTSAKYKQKMCVFACVCGSRKKEMEGEQER